jgi:tryptophanyl-tRNA synthetase
MESKNIEDTKKENTTSQAPEDNFEVTIENVTGKIDYKRLVEKFGTELIDENLLDKFKRVTGKDLHPWLKRGIFFSHRGLHQFLDAYENGDPVFLYTGRGPTSDAMHIGHLTPFMFTKWLQEVFDCPLVIQISDEEKAAFKKQPFQTIYKMGFENAKEIISCGFDPKKTFIFSNRDYRLEVRNYETFVSHMKMLVSARELQKIFGLNEESTIGMYDWPFYQTAAAFYQAYPHIFGTRPAYCLIPHAIDQDPYFRLARDIAQRMNLIKPCTIMCTFIPPLVGNSGKMSSSEGTSGTIFLNDKSEVIRQKVMSHAYSGGGGNGSLEDHKKFGGNPEIDTACQYLRYFEMDDDVLNRTVEGFRKGEVSCGETKELIVKKLIHIIEDVQLNRSKVSDEVLKDFYSLKEITLPLPKQKTQTEEEAKVYEKLKELGIEFRTKYHSMLATDEERADLAKTVEGVVCRASFLKGDGENYHFLFHHSNHKVDLKVLAKKLQKKKISNAQNDTLKQTLKNETAELKTLFGLLLDSSKKISVLIDSSIPKSEYVNFHPLRSDATTTISYESMLKFITSLGYEPTFVPE